MQNDMSNLSLDALVTLKHELSGKEGKVGGLWL